PSGFQDLPRREAARKSPKQPAGAFIVFKPPEVGNKWEAIYVDVLRMNQLQQAGQSMGAAEPALLGATPRRLGNPVRVEDLIDHHGARVDALGQAPPASDVGRPD